MGHNIAPGAAPLASWHEPAAGDQATMGMRQPAWKSS
eukprot:CAMPEP_0169295492 /NCGR_PEP_ID=MMETSP1016-20121227/64536_1 /TAXON_ID=342587 /ORGANISM="Karlodinium micrum, Strain CCMP2283" /LENGTH=36 /DNA_ID= /DNA_START= /DNA_END= /DNA_ORIENTATION=